MMNLALESNVQAIWCIVVKRNGPQIGLPADITYDVQTLFNTGDQGLYRTLTPERNESIAADDLIYAAREKQLCVVQVGPIVAPDTSPEDGSPPPDPRPILALYLMCPEQPVGGPCNTPPAQPTGGG